MIKTYLKPEIKVISFNEITDVIQTSGELAESPIATLTGYGEMADYGATDFSIFTNSNN